MVILDRDGTIVVDRHYLADPDALEFERGAEAGLRKMSALGLRLVVITNQSGIARGILSSERLQEIHERLKQMMHSIGAPLEAIYFCPHAPDEGCECRKPKLGLMRRAAEELGFDMSECIVIGDKDSDVEFGRRAGALTLQVGRGEARMPAPAGAEYLVRDLLEAADIIESLGRREPPGRS